MQDLTVDVASGAKVTVGYNEIKSWHTICVYDDDDILTFRVTFACHDETERKRVARCIGISECDNGNFFHVHRDTARAIGSALAALSWHCENAMPGSGLMSDETPR